MFFILSKTIGYLSQPLVIIGILLVLGIVLRNDVWRQRLIYAAIGLFFFFTNDFISNEVMRWWEVPPTPWEHVEKKKIGIVLCGVTRGDMDLRDRTYFSSGADRAYHTAELYHKGLIEKVFISGGSGRLIDVGEKEAIEIKNALIVMGVKVEDIDLEYDSRNTHENAVETIKRIRDNFPSEDCLLITSGFHMRRSLACFKKEGYDVTGFSADIRTNTRRFHWDKFIIPKAAGLDRWNHLMKEIVGYVAYWIVGYV